jgi:hypothetical protein
LSTYNIQKGFKKTGISPINPHIIEDKMEPSMAFVTNLEALMNSFASDESMDFEDDNLLVQEHIGDMVL